jgi:hypothetical protein
MAWARHKNKAIWRDSVAVVHAVIIGRYQRIGNALMIPYLADDPAPVAGYQLYYARIGENGATFVMLPDGTKKVIPLGDLS